MSEIKNDVENANIEVSVVEKDGLLTRTKNGAKKIFSSKPAKIVGGVLLGLTGGAIGYGIGKAAGSSTDECDCYDEDDVVYEEDLIPDEMVND